MKRKDPDIKKAELPSMLNEFRIALESEIEAAKKNAAMGKIQIINGHRIYQIAQRYQYIFDIENALNVPNDSPADLIIENRDPIEAYIVSVDGLKITLSVPEDIGNLIPNAYLSTDMTFLLRKLIFRIEENADSPNPVGNRVLGISKPSGHPIQISAKNLNREQERAVSFSVGRDITFIAGPPGTGKSKTIGSIGVELNNRNRSVLLVSHTNIAVDQALLYIGKSDEISREEITSGKIIRIGDPFDKSLKECPELLISTHVDRISKELKEKQQKLKTEFTNANEKLIVLSEKLILLEWVDDAPSRINRVKKSIKMFHNMENDADKKLEEKRNLKKTLDGMSKSVADAFKIREISEKLLDLHDTLNAIEKQITEHRVNSEKESDQLLKHFNLLEKSCESGWMKRKWRGLPHPEEQREIIRGLCDSLELQNIILYSLLLKKRAESQKKIDFEKQIDRFQSLYQENFKSILDKSKLIADRLTTLYTIIKDHEKEKIIFHKKIEQELCNMLIVCKEAKLTDGKQGSVENMIESIENAYILAASKVSGLDIETLQNEIKNINDSARTMRMKIDKIDESLNNVQEKLISDASIIATTLTRVYLNDFIQARHFDTVILDEASMAPIPSLWIAANLAKNNAVVVGDRKQLSPIVQSENDLAKEWLGKDIFEKSGVYKSQSKFDCLVPLKEQFRMHPQISAISNSLIYDGQLTNGPGTDEDSSLDAWYNRWDYDQPVLLIDTGPTNAWVTAVPKGKRASRLNFLSASICVGIAEQLLKDGRPKLDMGAKPRILIVCPYRAHATLLDILIKESGLNGEVAAGTAHNFQGSEADVVIADFVIDEPHWKANLFIPKLNDEMKRLLNVALTRARKRLIIVGDYDYIMQKGKKSFAGVELVPFLKKKYRKINAVEAVECNIFENAASAQKLIYPGVIVPNASRLIMNQDVFYNIFTEDINNANKRIVIFSPFISQDRINKLMPQMQAAISRGIKIFAITKDIRERSNYERPVYHKLEKHLADCGIVVIHKKGMHEKVVFIDDEIIWTGSLNPLSYKNTQELMERRVSLKVYEDYIKTLRVDELVSPYDGKQHKCPICGSEMIASEGNLQPYFWRCPSESCYTRNIDETPIQGDILFCSKCGGELEPGEWGEKPCWRCTQDKRHRMKMSCTHLKLPHMKNKIDPDQLIKIKAHLGCK